MAPGCARNFEIYVPCNGGNRSQRCSVSGGYARVWQAERELIRFPKPLWSFERDAPETVTVPSHLPRLEVLLCVLPCLDGSVKLLGSLCLRVDAQSARRAYRGNRPAIRRRHARSKGGICLRLDAAQDKIGGLSGHLSLLSNIYSEYCTCGLGGDGCGELTSDATRRVRYGRESRSAVLSMTSLRMARPFFSSPCLEK